MVHNMQEQKRASRDLEKKEQEIPKNDMMK